MNPIESTGLRVLSLEDSDLDAELILRELRRGGIELISHRVQTCAEFERFGVPRDRMFVTGWIRRWEQFEISGDKAGVFGVILNGENGAESNENLLQMANRVSEILDLRYVVRLHPSYAPDRYQRLVNDRCEQISAMPMSRYVSAVDFSITHSSSAAIEMLQVELPVYVLDDGCLAQVFRRPGLSYSDLDAMLSAIRADSGDAVHARERFRALRMWYNDDTDQPDRLRAALTVKKE